MSMIAANSSTTSAADNNGVLMDHKPKIIVIRLFRNLLKKIFHCGHKAVTGVPNEETQTDIRNGKTEKDMRNGTTEKDTLNGTTEKGVLSGTTEKDTLTVKGRTARNGPSEKGSHCGLLAKPGKGLLIGLYGQPYVAMTEKQMQILFTQNLHK